MKGWSKLERLFLGAFLFWLTCGLIFTVGRIHPDAIAAWHVPDALRAFILFCVHTGDPLLILLAFANTHLLASRQWGARAARRWALLVLAASLAVETLGTLTGFPFGAYRYTDRFGPLLGAVPPAIPLAWQVVLTNALFLVRGRAPHLPRWAEALAAGVIATLYDAVLEPFATTIKGYWHWSGGTVPTQNYFAWLVVGSGLVFLAAPSAALSRPRDARPVILLAGTIVLFVAARAAGP